MPKSCAELKCPAPGDAPEKTACAETQEGPTCYKPFPVEPPPVVPPPVTPPVEPPPVEPPPVEPPPVVPPPVEPPPPAVCMVEADLVAVPDPQPAKQLQAQVRRAIEELGPATGIAPAVSLEKLAAKLRSYGLCAIAGIEAVFVRRSDGLVEEYHAVYFGDGSWTDSNNGHFMGIHSDGGGPPTPPVEPPTVDFGCPAPRPDRVWTAETLPPGWGSDQIGQPRWKLNSSPHLAWIDSTAVTVRNEPYCRAIGMSPMLDGTLRAGCPMRNEGGDFAERVACERYIAEGDWVVVASGGAICEANPDNSAQFRRTSAGGTCRLCNPAQTVCTEAY
jgi:hypothetical protein